MLAGLELGSRQELEESGRQIRDLFAFGLREPPERPFRIDQHVGWVDARSFDGRLDRRLPIHQVVPKMDRLDFCVLAVVCELLRRGDVPTRVLAIRIETQGEFLQA